MPFRKSLLKYFANFGTELQSQTIKNYRNYSGILPLGRHSFASNVEYGNLILLFFISKWRFASDFAHASVSLFRYYKTYFPSFQYHCILFRVKACYIHKYLATLLSKESMAFSTVKPVLNL